MCVWLWGVGGLEPEFSPNFKFKNSRFIFGTETGQELASPNGGTETGPGKGCSRMFGTINFLEFLGKIQFPGNGIQERRLLVITGDNKSDFFHFSSLFSYLRLPICQIIILQRMIIIIIFFFNCLPNEYFDSIKGRISDSYSVIGQV